MVRKLVLDAITTSEDIKDGRGDDRGYVKVVTHNFVFILHVFFGRTPEKKHHHTAQVRHLH